MSNAANIQNNLKQLTRHLNSNYDVDLNWKWN